MLYLDHNATNPIRPEVLDVVARVQRDFFGNPSSPHAVGRAARAHLEECRERFAAAVGASPVEVVFTSGGTEANRLAIDGALAAQPDLNHAVVSAIEHPSVLGAFERRPGVSTSRVAAGECGRVSIEAIRDAVGASTALIALQHVNNETGVLQDVAELARVISETERSGRPAPVLLVDAVQALGKVASDWRGLGANLYTCSSHKLGGPKGVGALCIARGTPFRAPFTGGPQERGLRPGTENLPAISGFVRAVELASADSDVSAAMGKRLWCGLEQIEGVVRNGDSEWAVGSTINVAFKDIDGELLLIALDADGVAASMGAACASGSREPSHVLQAMGYPEARVRSSLRFSTGWSTTAGEVDAAVDAIRRVVARLRR